MPRAVIFGPGVRKCAVRHGYLSVHSGTASNVPQDTEHTAEEQQYNKADTRDYPTQMQPIGGMIILVPNLVKKDAIQLFVGRSSFPMRQKLTA